MFQSPAQNLLEEERRKISENTFFMKILGQFLLAFWGGGGEYSDACGIFVAELAELFFE